MESDVRRDLAVTMPVFESIVTEFAASPDNLYSTWSLDVSSRSVAMTPRRNEPGNIIIKCYQS